jgi:hypothetical protein
MEVIKCEYCGKNAEVVITKIMQPSYPHDSCVVCLNDKGVGYMVIKKILPNSSKTKEVQ